jgi:hypothetical protein
LLVLPFAGNAISSHEQEQDARERIAMARQRQQRWRRVVAANTISAGGVVVVCLQWAKEEEEGACCEVHADHEDDQEPRVQAGARAPRGCLRPQCKQR